MDYRKISLAIYKGKGYIVSACIGVFLGWYAGIQQSRPYVNPSLYNSDSIWEKFDDLLIKVIIFILTISIVLYAEIQIRRRKDPLRDFEGKR